MVRALIAITLLLAACRETNPYYCEGHPDDNCTLDADVNAPQGCTTSAECTSSAKPVCDPGQKLCVSCTADMIGACAGTTPVCATATNTCMPCITHAQCGSQACLPDGSCGNDSTVAYVAANGNDGDECTRDAPCLHIGMAASKGRPFVKVQTDLDEAVLLANANVTILAEPGVSIRRSSVGAIFEIRGTSNVAIHELTIRDGLGTTGHGIMVPAGEPVNLTLDRVNVINNSGSGINVQGGTLSLSRCIVSGNNAGGAYVNARFTITNSLFVANGNTLSSTGGLFLTPAGSVTFRFNTVANNVAGTGAITGINCGLAVLVANTILAQNDAATACAFQYSLFDQDPGGQDSTNRVGNAKFKTVLATNPFAGDYFRIQSDSAAVDGGDPASTMLLDIDGDARPQGSAPDIGADELN
jgi:hypothetical protein